MIRRWLSRAVKWAIETDLAEVKTEIATLQGTLGRHLIEVGHMLREPDPATVIVAYYVVYGYSWRVSDYANAPRASGVGTTTINIIGGGITNAETLGLLREHIKKEMPDLLEPQVWITFYSELRRWIKNDAKDTPNS